MAQSPTANVREAHATIVVRTNRLESRIDGDALDYLPKLMPVLCAFLKDYTVGSINIERHRIIITIHLTAGNTDFNGLAGLLSRAIDELVGDEG